MKIELLFVPGKKYAQLRELCGVDEEMLTATDTYNAIQLLNQLLVGKAPYLLQPGQAQMLPAATRDRLLAQVYLTNFGSKVSGLFDCSQCQETFEIDFQLPELLQSLTPPTHEFTQEEDGYFHRNGRQQFRLPSGEQELSLSALSPDDAAQLLFELCVPDKDSDWEQESLQRAMRTVAPLVDLELHATCPECKAPQTVHFDIQTHLLQTVLSEQAQLTRDIHCIAKAYRWRFKDIMELPRTRRKAQVQLIESEYQSATLS